MKIDENGQIRQKFEITSEEVVTEDSYITKIDTFSNKPSNQAMLVHYFGEYSQKFQICSLSTVLLFPFCSTSFRAKFPMKKPIPNLKQQKFVVGLKN